MLLFLLPPPLSYNINWQSQKPMSVTNKNTTTSSPKKDSNTSFNLNKSFKEPVDTLCDGLKAVSVSYQFEDSLQDSNCGIVVSDPKWVNQMLTKILNISSETLSTVSAIQKDQEKLNKTVAEQGKKIEKNDITLTKIDKQTEGLQDAFYNMGPQYFTALTKRFSKPKSSTNSQKVAGGARSASTSQLANANLSSSSSREATGGVGSTPTSQLPRHNSPSSYTPVSKKPQDRVTASKNSSTRQLPQLSKRTGLKNNVSPHTDEYLDDYNYYEDYSDDYNEEDNIKLIIQRELSKLAAATTAETIQVALSEDNLKKYQVSRPRDLQEELFLWENGRDGEAPHSLLVSLIKSKDNRSVYCRLRYVKTSVLFAKVAMSAEMIDAEFAYYCMERYWRSIDGRYSYKSINDYCMNTRKDSNKFFNSYMEFHKFFKINGGTYLNEFKKMKSLKSKY